MRKMIKVVSLLGLLTMASVFTGCSVTPPQPFSGQVNSSNISEEQKAMALNKSLKELVWPVGQATGGASDVDNNNCLWVNGRIKDSKDGYKIKSMRKNCYKIQNDKIVKLPEEFKCVITNGQKYGELEIDKCSEGPDNGYWRNYIKFVDAMSNNIPAKYNENVLIQIKNNSLIAKGFMNIEDLHSSERAERTDWAGNVHGRNICSVYMAKGENLARYYAHTWVYPEYYNKMSDTRYGGMDVLAIKALIDAKGNIYGNLDIRNLDLQTSKMNLKSNMTSMTQAKNIINFLNSKQSVQLVQAYFAANDIVGLDFGKGLKINGEYNNCRFWAEDFKNSAKWIVETLLSKKDDSVHLKLFIILGSDGHPDDKAMTILNLPGVKRMYDIISSSSN